MSGMSVDQAVAFVVAIALGFLAGRTRGESEEEAPGIRDFVIASGAGSLCGLLGSSVLTAVTAIGLIAAMIAMRLQKGSMRGLTTEFAAVMIFLIGYLCATPFRPIAAAAGIALAMILSRKETLHRFALRVISQKEFDDILSFLALILIVFPLLPPGSYGPFQFFEPRKIGLFVIMICGVSFIGYFLIKFVGTRLGIWLTAILGGLASTTAYTASASQEVKEAPESGPALAGTTLLANTIMFPRMALILGAFSQPLALAALPALGTMTVVGLASAWLLCRKGFQKKKDREAIAIDNPFALWPAVKLGILFTIVLFAVKAVRAWLGSGSELLTAAVAGLVDVDAIMLSMAELFGQQQIEKEAAVLTVLIAATANAFFKSGLAITSKVPGFYVRVILGFLMIFAAGGVVLVLSGVVPLP